MHSVDEVVRSLYERLKDGDSAVEERRLDIKREWHHANSSRTKDEIREEFCKDVCALANSSFPSEGFIVFGLSPHPPFAVDASMPLDEASLQQQLAAGISPPPQIRFSTAECAGAKLCVAVITPSLRSLPYVARYKNNLWIPWVRQGSSTRSASHLDLVSMFDLRGEHDRSAVPRIDLLDSIWADNWSTGAPHWASSSGRPRGSGPNPGLQCKLRLVNAGMIPTALLHMSATLEWPDGGTVTSGDCYAASWPLPIPERDGRDANAMFSFPGGLPASHESVSRLLIRTTDLDQKRSEFEFKNLAIRLP